MSDRQHRSTNQRAGFPLFTPASGSAVQSHSSDELNRRDLTARLEHDWIPVISISVSQEEQLHLTGTSDGCLIFSEEKKVKQETKLKNCFSVSQLNLIDVSDVNWVHLLNCFSVFIPVNRFRWGCSSVMGLPAVGGVTDVAQHLLGRKALVLIFNMYK